MNALLALLMLVAIGAAALGHARWTRSPATPLARAVFGLATLLGITGYLVEALGLFGAFRPVALTIGVAALWLLALALVFRYFRLSGGEARSWSTIDGLLVLVCLAFTVLTLTGALGPATSNEWDALAYHLAVPKVWLADGRIHPIPYDHHSNFPMLTEMLFAIGLAWKSVPVAKLFHWLFGMLCALACYWAGRRWASRTTGLVAAALFLAVPVVAWEATTAYIDLASTLYVALSVFAFVRWLEGNSPSPADPLSPGETGSGATHDGWLYLAGVMAGLATGTKMTMIATSGLLVLWAAGCAILRRPGGVRWKHVGILAGLALVIGGPWYVKTWLWTGNPFYPFAYGILDGRWWSAQAAAAYTAEQARFGIGKSLWALWVSPWTTAFFAQYYANPPDTFTGTLNPVAQNVFPAVFGSIGLGVIGFFPLWLLAPGLKRGDEARTGNGALMAMVLYSGVFVLVWFGLTHQTRYLMPLLPLLLVPGAAGARAFWRAGRGWRWGVGALAAVALLMGLMPLWVLVQPLVPVAWGGESRTAYLRQTEPVYRVSQRINRELPTRAKVLLLQEVRGFYIDRPYQWGNPEQNALIPWETFQTPRQMDSALRAQGITHVLVNWGALAPQARGAAWVRLVERAVAEGLWTPVIVMGPDPQKGFTVYEIGRAEPAS